MDKSIVPFSDSDSNPRKFDFNGTPITPYIGADGEPFFVASEVCKALGLENTSEALRALDTDEKDDIRLPDLTGRLQEIRVVNESGLYHLIFKSRKSTAVKFRKWVTEEVLPTIRKTGSYVQKPPTQAEYILMLAQQSVEQERKLTEHDERIVSLEARVGKPEWYTLTAYCRLRRIPQPLDAQARVMGKRAVALSKARGIEIGDVEDSRYLTVHTYHLSILDELFGGSHDR